VVSEELDIGAAFVLVRGCDSPGTLKILHKPFMARKTSEGGYPPVPLYRRETLHFDGLLGACRVQGMRMFRDAGALFGRGVAPNISPIDARGNASRFHGETRVAAIRAKE
jgi:hypothetical protein